jgi:hypothetical protein
MTHRWRIALLATWLACGLPAAAAPTVGTVEDVEVVAPYVYLKLAVGDREIWIAALSSAVQAGIGDEVEFGGGMVMRDFHSKGMNQTFESLVLVDHVRNLSNPDPLKSKPIPDDDVHRAVNQPLVAPVPGEIERAKGDRTVAEVHADREALEGQRVQVRAKIMKVSPNVMGKNWVTLQDGTGSAPHDKLIVTTQEQVFPGEVMTVVGRVQTDVNLGSGYSYAVLLEEAEFKSSD